MITKYRCSIAEITTELLGELQDKYKERDVEITISDEGDESSYLMSTEANRKHLERSMRDIEEGNVISMTLEEFQERYGRQ